MRNASDTTVRLCPYRYRRLDIFPPVTCLLCNVHTAGWSMLQARLDGQYAIAGGPQAIGVLKGV